MIPLHSTTRKNVCCCCCFITKTEAQNPFLPTHFPKVKTKQTTTSSSLLSYVISSLLLFDSLLWASPLLLSSSLSPNETELQPYATNHLSTLTATRGLSNPSGTMMMMIPAIQVSAAKRLDGHRRRTTTMMEGRKRCPN